MINRLRNIGAINTLCIGASVLLLFLLSMVFVRGCSSKKESCNCKDSVIVKHDTIPLGGTLSSSTTITSEEDEDEPNNKPLPVITKYKVSDCVTAWGKFNGVVISIRWSNNDPNVLVYNVKHFDAVENDWTSSEFYDTELTAGKCQ